MGVKSTSRPTSRKGADGKKIGVFILHGGSGDSKIMERVAKLFACKFGCKVVAMTFPGRLYLEDPSRDWPGDTIHPDGTVRTPIWHTGERITPDQYEVVRDNGNAASATARAPSPAPSPARASATAWPAGRRRSRRA